jgi:hypothetical protein
MGGMRAGGGRVGMAGGPGRAHISQPIAGVGRPGVGRPGGPGWAGRPGGPGWAGRPGYGGGGWAGYRPGYGWGAAAAAGAIGAAAYGAYGGYYGGYYEDPYAYSYPSYSYETAAAPGSDAIAECARRFKTYDMATQTYVKSKGVRASCP